MSYQAEGFAVPRLADSDFQGLESIDEIDACDRQTVTVEPLDGSMLGKYTVVSFHYSL